MKNYNFQYGDKNDRFYYTFTEDYFYCSVEGFDHQYLYRISNDTFYHKFVDFQGNDYEDCNEKLKNDILKEFEDRIKQIKKEEGISDDSDNPETVSTTNEDKTTTNDDDDSTPTDKNDNSDDTAMYILNFLLFALLFIFI